MRTGAHGCHGCLTCATQCRAPQRCPKSGWVSLRNDRCRHGAATRSSPDWCIRSTQTAASSRSLAAPLRKIAAKSCCSPIPSTTLSNPRSRMTRSRCSKRPATPCTSHCPRTAAAVRCAAGARFSRPAWSIRQSLRRNARWRRCCPTLSAAQPSSASSHRVCCQCAMNFLSWDWAAPPSVSHRVRF